jgi:cation:H+ antiporter
VLAVVLSLPALPALLLFAASVAVAMSASAWFTRRLEALCDRLDLSPGILSLLSALGANIPNYVASIDAFSSHRPEIGLGIILGSNIFNVAIILGIATFAAPGRVGIRLLHGEISDARVVGSYACVVLLLTLFVTWLLHGLTFLQGNTLPSLLLLIMAALAALAAFAGFALHIARRTHTHHGVEEEPYIEPVSSRASLPGLLAEIVLALAIALAGVVFMVQSGQAMTTDLHIPEVLAGLLVLAVATSLPNAVVAFILARSGREAACIEEIFSSNSINAALGIALPALIWHDGASDPLLLALDAPLMVLLTLVLLLCARSGRVSRPGGLLFLVVYVLWVGVHVWV